MKLVAIVPATDAPATLARCKDAILAAHEPPEDIVIVEDPSVGGPAQARNLAARQATADLLVFVDSDVEVHADAFARFREAFARDPELAAVFGSYDDDPERHGLVSDFRNLLHHHVHHGGAGPATTFWAGLGAVKRDMFLEVGGFDEQRFPHASIEDIELGMRIAARGGRIVLDPRIQGKHLKRWTLTSMIQTDLLRRGIPWVQLIAEQRLAGGNTLNLSWRHRASAAMSVFLVAALIARRPRYAAGALVAFGALNAPFYRLLLRRRGGSHAAAGVALHAVHHLTGTLAVPAGAALHLWKRLSGARDKS